MLLGQTVRSIVLLEDDPDDETFVRNALIKAGIGNPLLVFDSPADARQHFDSHSDPSHAPALFILDVHMPGGETGIDFLQWLRRQPTLLGSTPVMMLSGSQEPHHQQDSRWLGAVFFLRKPVDEHAFALATQELGFVLVTGPSREFPSRFIERR